MKWIFRKCKSHFSLKSFRNYFGYPLIKIYTPWQSKKTCCDLGSAFLTLIPIKPHKGPTLQPVQATVLIIPGTHQAFYSSSYLYICSYMLMLLLKQLTSLIPHPLINEEIFILPQLRLCYFQKTSSDPLLHRLD